MKFLTYSFLFACLLLFSCETEKTNQTPKWKRTVNEVVIRQEASPGNLNPVVSTTSYEKAITDQIFFYLLNVNHQTFDFIPELIKAMPEIETLESGGEAFRFEIHDNAVWDDGKQVTGDDFSFTIKSILVPEMPTAIVPYVTLIKDIQVDKANPKKFTVITHKKSADALEWIGSSMYVLPQHIYDPQNLLGHISCKDFFDKKTLASLAETDKKITQFRDNFLALKYSKDPDFISGCGPYKLIKWADGKEIILEKKENWWGDKHTSTEENFMAFPDRLIFKFIVDDITTIAAIQSEEIDVASNISPKSFLQLKNDPKLSAIYDFEMPPYYAYYYYALNTRRPKLADKRVRQALAHTVDLEQMIDVIYAGIASPLNAPVHPASLMYNHEIKPYTYNIAKAKELLKAAGWEDTNDNGIVDKEMDGEKVEMELEFLYIAGSDRAEKQGVLYEETAKKAGIKIILKGVDFKIAKQNTAKGDYDIYPKGRAWPPVSWNPKQEWHTTSSRSITGFGSSQTDALIDKILNELDDGKKMEMIKEFQAIVHEECPEIYLITPNSRVIVHKRFNWKASAVLPGFSPNAFKLKTQE